MGGADVTLQPPLALQIEVPQVASNVSAPHPVRKICDIQLLQHSDVALFTPRSHVSGASTTPLPHTGGMHAWKPSETPALLASVFSQKHVLTARSAAPLH